MLFVTHWESLSLGVVIRCVLIPPWYRDTQGRPQLHDPSCTTLSPPVFPTRYRSPFQLFQFSITPIMSAQGLSSLQEEARQIIQEMEKQKLELFIKTERAAGKKGW